jgi:thiosulfate dehydrogenase [quinone] large subunit
MRAPFHIVHIPTMIAWRAMKQQVQRTRKIEPARRPEPVEPPHAAPSLPASHTEHAPQSAATIWDWRRAVSAMIPAWVFAPLRLFLGVTFIYAGIQKLTDPQYFNTHAPGYIGKQIQAFATGSPLHGLLINGVLPHASFWGAIIAWGELAIGLGALVGFLLRPAAFFGLLLSVIFFLSASWRVRPYFYGADIVFVFAWLTLLLAGPLAGALPALDTWLAPSLLRRVPAERREQVASALALLLGVPLGEPSAPVEERAPAPAMRSKGGTRAAQRARYAQATATRRDFLKGALVGGGVMLIASWLWNVTHPAPVVPSGSTGGGGATDGATGSASSGSNEIALVKDVPVNSSAQFTIPSNGDPGVLVHLDTNKFVAFDATCTHAGCPVSYDPSSKLLLCPCHGAAFDPSQDAAVVQGPAPTPLTPVPVTVDQNTGAITLS